MPLATLAAIALLATCGDDPYDAPAAAPVAEAEDTVPACATASAQAYVRFAAALPLHDRGPPRQLDGVMAPTSETGEP